MKKRAKDRKRPSLPPDDPPPYPPGREDEDAADLLPPDDPPPYPPK